MYFKIQDELYDVEIVKKITTKNTYIRVKDDLTIYVTTNLLVADREIEKLLKKSTDTVLKMINQKRKKEEYENNFYFLGKKYDIVYTNDETITLGSEKVFLDNRIDLDKWYKKEAMRIFKDRLDYNYQKFSRKIPYPSLMIRKMKTRWGVCNIKNKTPPDILGRSFSFLIIVCEKYKFGTDAVFLCDIFYRISLFPGMYFHVFLQSA